MPSTRSARTDNGASISCATTCELHCQEVTLLLVQATSRLAVAAISVALFPPALARACGQRTRWCVAERMTRRRFADAPSGRDREPRPPPAPGHSPELAENAIERIPDLLDK